MSILATMKFIVRGKSVDFKNHEGSSPSIPKKTIWLPNSLSYPFDLTFFVSGSKILILLIHFYTKGSERKSCSLITCHIIYDIYIWYMYKWTSLSKESPFEWFTIEIFIHTETHKVVLLTNYRNWMRLCNTLSIDIDPRSLVKWNEDETSGIVGIAQLVEQRTENPRVTSSNLVPDTWLICMSVYSTN